MVTKDEIKEWLRETGRSRQWLADACRVQPGTVNNWLSTSIQVPHKALRIIESLMRADRDASTPAPAPPPSYLVLRITIDEFEEWSRIALAEGMTVTEWIISVIRDTCREDQAEKTPEARSHADAPAPAPGRASA